MLCFSSYRSVSSLESGIVSAVSGNTILLNRGVHKLNEMIESSISIIGKFYKFYES